MLRIFPWLAALSVTASPLRTVDFDRDPGWEGYNNRVQPTQTRRVHQDFGWATNRIGGRVQRSTTPASYALALAPAKTLNDTLSASGDFTLLGAQTSGGMFFGFFNSQRPAGSGRPIGSLGFNFDFEASGGRVMAHLINSNNQSAGTFITPYLPGKYRPTPLRADGRRYHWTLDYDPHGANDNGRFVVTISDGAPPPPLDATLTGAIKAEALARFPYTTNFSVDVTPGYKAAGAAFDRFGLCDAMKYGGTTTVYFDRLVLNGQPLDLSADPHWTEEGNHADFEDHEQTGAHWFGYSPDTRFAGGARGEVGGLMWRGGEFAYYADRIGPLDLTQRLEARGKVKLVTAAPDSDICLGWFNSASTNAAAGDKKNFVGIRVGGPTRVGHYFAPAMSDADGVSSRAKRASVLVPGRDYEWSLVYDPTANSGNGELRAMLGGETVVSPLKPGQKATGATLDRFGLFTLHHSGGMVKIYLDDLAYSANP